jgi:Plasmid encoded RepA protein
MPRTPTTRAPDLSPDSPDGPPFCRRRASISAAKSTFYAGSGGRVLTDAKGESGNPRIRQRFRGLRACRLDPHGESGVTLSGDYFASLQRHAVPLDERALAALSHNAMALDVYCWLAQRLHRVDPNKPAFIGWAALRNQFGWHYSAMFKFRQVFRQTLDLVCSQYRGARIEIDGRGLTLCHSSPPVKGRVAFVAKA